VTLADYLRTLRQYRLFIVIVAIACAGAAFAFSKLQTPKYEATASLEVQNPAADLNLLGRGAFSGETPLQISSAHASQVTRRAVLNEVRAEFDDQISVTDLEAKIEVEVDPNSFLVDVTATSEDAREAALVANTLARVDARLSASQARRTYAAAAERLRDRIATLPSLERGTNSAFYLDRLSSLESLSTVASPVTVVEEATIPTSPSTPKTLRNTVAAGIFGVLLGIALALGRQLLDRRLREPADAEEIFGYPVVARLRPEAFGHTGSLKDTQVKGLGTLDPIDGEAFRMLRENVRYLAIDSDLRTIVVTSAVPEEGKSTVAACLAMASASAGIRTLLLECDLRRRVLAARLGIAEAPGLSDYLVGRAEPQDVLQPVRVPTGPGENGAAPRELICITAGSEPPQPADLLHSQRFETFLSQVGKVYEKVIIDCPPLLPVADTLEIVPHVDAVLAVARLNRTTRDQAQAAHEALDRLPDRPTGLVLTGFKDRETDYYRSYYTYRADEAPRKRGLFIGRKSRSSDGASADTSVEAGTAAATRESASKSPGTT
jgi:capsular exopolysaccharide synthesis family protein